MSKVGGEKWFPPRFSICLVVTMWCAAARPSRATHKHVAHVHVHAHPRAHAHHSPIHTLFHTTTLSRTHIHQCSQRQAGRTRSARSQLLAKSTGHWCRRSFCMGSVFFGGKYQSWQLFFHVCMFVCVFVCVCVCFGLQVVCGCGEAGCTRECLHVLHV